MRHDWTVEVFPGNGRFIYRRCGGESWRREIRKIEGAWIKIHNAWEVFKSCEEAAIVNILSQ